MTRCREMEKGRGEGGQNRWGRGEWAEWSKGGRGGGGGWSSLFCKDVQRWS